jgi:hypothetical protein
VALQQLWPTVEVIADPRLSQTMLSTLQQDATEASPIVIMTSIHGQRYHQSRFLTGVFSVKISNEYRTNTKAAGELFGSTPRPSTTSPSTEIVSPFADSCLGVLTTDGASRIPPLPLRPLSLDQDVCPAQRPSALRSLCISWFH